MISKWAALACLILFFTNYSWAADIENQLDAVEDAKAEEEEDNGACSRLTKAKRAFKAWRHYYLDKLGTPEGATAVACVYGITQGISNFIWAFDWEGHVGFSSSTSKSLQEISGITSAVECVVIGALVPAMLYSYQRKHGPPELRR